MKQTIISLSVILVATAICFGLIYERNKRQETLLSACPTDVMMCPDGSSVPRSGPKCEFGVCKQEVPAPKDESSQAVAADITMPSATKPTEKIVSTGLFTKVTSSATSLFKKATGALGKDVSTGIKETSKTPPESPQKTPSALSSSMNEKRYTVDGNHLVDQNNNIIYTLPPNSSDAGTHIVDAVAVNQVAPIIGAVPVTGLPGKYYLSENTFGSKESCNFSNKIYILDTNTNSRTLMYEENNTILGADDPRGCDREMYLLATENEKLILKYHTIGTNMTCDSTWSEPENTWYLDVTNIDKGTRRYWISPTLSSQAEVLEASCRSSLATSTTP